MTLTVEGFCYHCLNCGFTSGFERNAVLHSDSEEHGIIRRFRGNCEIHNGNPKC
jgi:hypothetical protein